MKILRLLNTHGLPLTTLDVSTWPDLELSCVKPKHRDSCDRYKKAITRLIRDQLTTSAAAREWGVDRSELERKLERCLEPAPDGRIQGFRGLAPYLRLKPYQRRTETKSGTAGLFTELMDKFPAIGEQLWQEYKRGESTQQLKKLLLEELLPKAGWPQHKYPYNMVHRGVEALRQYLKRRELKTAADEWAEQGPTEEKRVVTRPFERVQLDAHRCDAHFTVHVEGPEGISRTLVLERIWLLVLIDEGSRAVLGYALSLNRQCNISDVLEAVHTTIVPQPRRTLTIPGLGYRPGAGFPNQLIPICAWQKLDLLCLDNAMAHRSPRTHQILNEKLQCAIRLNRAGTPNDNQFIERFFATITAHGCKRTVSSTGSGPKDPHRTDSEHEAERYEFVLSDAEQLLDVLMANYNIDMNRGIDSSPLDYLRSYYRDQPALTRHVPPSQRDNWSLRELWDDATVRGDAKTGERPWVQYLEADYRAEFLTAMPELIGQPILLRISVDDLRSLNAYLPDGRHLGLLRVCGRWALTKHSLKTRRLICQLARAGILHIGYGDPVRALRIHLEEQAKINKAARNQLARLLREIDQPSSTATTTADEEPDNRSFVPTRDDWISLRTPVYD